MKSVIGLAVFSLFVPLAYGSALNVELVSARDYKLSNRQFQEMMTNERHCQSVFRDALIAYVSQLGFSTLSVNNYELVLEQARLVAVEDQTQGSIAIARLAKYQVPLRSGGTAFIVAKTRGDLFCEHEVLEGFVGGFLNIK